MALQPRDSRDPEDASGVLERARLLAGLLLVLAVAWSTPLGKISPDTKTDLYIDPVGFMARALHLWDPQVTWGVLQNQGYGYLFPMGPFFAAVGSIAPMWVAQRLWWSLLLTAGYLGMAWLLRELGIKGGWVVHLAALAYALSPRVITTLGGLSSESAPALLAPLVLAPVVAASRGRIGPRRAAALSGLAVLGCGGVNATATLFAVVPAAVWVLSRSRWWRQGLAWWWAAAVLCATAWWAVPLVLLGRYSPPFLDWIEDARMVSSLAGLLDVLRGTSHWLGHLLTPDGPWWPAGQQLVSDPWVVLATVLIAALGLAGLASGSVPHRGFLLALMLIGLVVLAVPHAGPLASPFSPRVLALLDGSLSPFRNVHKADPLLRLPLTVGLAHVLARVALRQRSWSVSAPVPHRVAASGLVTAVTLAVVWGASPGMDGHLAPRGAFSSLPQAWEDAADWLGEHAAGRRSLIVPSASFGEYTWGRPLDEPLRPLTEVPYAVRDAVPLTPANTIRLLDAVEQRLQSGRDIEAAVEVLARLGVGFLVLRNDLDTEATGLPPVMFAGSSIRSTPSVRLAAAFGTRTPDLTGVRVPPVEIYQITLPVAEAVELWPATAVTAASGASEALPALADASGRLGPWIFDGDAIEAFDPPGRVETDAYRARERFFGVTRGQDASSGLTSAADRTVSDYLPWEDRRWRSVVLVEGARAVTASSSIATEHSIVGLRPAHRPLAALDADPSTGWLAFADEVPRLEIVLDGQLSPAGLRITPFTEDRVFGRGLGVPTRVRVVTDGGAVTHDIDPSGDSQPVPGRGATSGRISIEILDTTRGDPGGTLTGLAEVSLSGLDVRERVAAGPTGSSPTDVVVLGVGHEASGDGCLLAQDEFRCVSGQFRAAEETGALHRAVSVTGPGDFDLSGTLVANPLIPPARSLLIGAELVDVTASSVRALGAAGAPTAAFDLDPRTAWSPAAGDLAPQLRATFVAPTTVSEIQLRTRDRWAGRRSPVVRVNVDGDERFGRLTADGRLAFPAMTGRTLAITVVRDAKGLDAAASLEIEEVGLVGVARSRPASAVTAACGEGPVLLVNGIPFPTRLSGTREAALGFDTMTWTACLSVGLGYLPTDTVDLAAWGGMSPGTVLAQRATDGAGASGGEEPRGPEAVGGLTRVGPTEFVGQVGNGPGRLLVMTDNANAGWTGQIGGVELTPITVDGFRQGFLIPDGVQGALSIRFAPDDVYRLALGVGGLLALLLVPLGVGPPGRPVDAPPARWPAPAPAAARVVALLVGGAIAGWWGVLAAVGMVATLWLPVASRWRVGLVAVLVLTAGVVEVVHLSTDLSAHRAEVATRVLVLLAIVAVVARPSGRPGPRGTDG